LEVWSDERNVVGEEWRPQLADAIDRATLALVLVSDELLASKFVMEQELPALRERGVPLACALVGDCLWQEEPVLERVEWWSEVFEPPCVGFAQDGAEVRRLAKAGADFVAVGEFLWTDARGAAQTLAMVAAELRSSELV